MPEGPEVSIISNFLERDFSNEEIAEVSIEPGSRYDQKDTRFDNLVGLTIKSITFKGKKIIFIMNDGSFILSFLGMEGRWNTITKSNMNTPHLSIKITFKSGIQLGYWDTRHFGCVEHCSDRKSLDTKLLTVGTPWISSEMFPISISKDELYKHLQNKRLNKKSIMMFLMDQKYTSGVGNYIRSDALYYAGISPHRLVNTITKNESDKIFVGVNKVINSSIKNGGHTLRSYVNPSGKQGGYVPVVYGRTVSNIKSEKITKEKDTSGRSIFWVQTAQV